MPKLRPFAFATALVMTCAAVDGQAPTATRLACTTATFADLSNVTSVEVATVPGATTGLVRAPHCRVTGVIDGAIGFRLLLPDEWNGKFAMGGGGGFAGEVEIQYEHSVNRGYAMVGTDTGHRASPLDASWALRRVDRQRNYGYLGVHRTAEIAKAMIGRYYPAPLTRAYFLGCSNGGREALMEAQRYPDDFNGIVAGAPAADFVGLTAQFIKDAQAVFPDPKNLTPIFSSDTLASIETQILSKCDALDGVSDNVIDDPRRCSVDVATLNGLTDKQRRALKTIYSETPARGEVGYPARLVGGEGTGWASWITGMLGQAPSPPSLGYAVGTEFYKNFVFADPAWDYSRYDVAKLRRDARAAGAMLNATNPDLKPFNAKGGKLIVWHGWADPALSALATIRYHEQVHARDAQADGYLRTFLLPGVQHCGDGEGPDQVDWTSAIEDWVERGREPARLVARKIVNGAAVRTRPICAYPQEARYTGTGSTDDETNFQCR